MKILFKLWKFPGVSETFLLAQIAIAVKEGYRVKVLIKEKPDVLENNIHEEFIKKYNLKDKIIFEKLKIPTNKFFRIAKAFFLLLVNFQHLSEIYQFFKHRNFRDLNHIFQFHFYKRFKDYDLIHVQYGTNAKPIDLLKKVGLIKSKLVVSFHGHDSFFPINGIIQNDGYYNDLFEYGDLIVANTPYLEKVINDLGCPANKIISIPVGVDTSYFHPVKRIIKKDNFIRLISVGRLDKIKGHELLIEVIDNLKNSGQSVFLTIIGDGPQRKFLEKLIEERNLSNVIKLIGSRNQEKVREILWEHDIYILTSIPVENGRQETQGLATIEAQACGLPAIVFDSGGVKYTVEDKKTGFVVPQGDLSLMTTRIIDLIENPDLYSEMRSKTKGFIEKNYSHKVIEDRWCTIYIDLINER